MNNSETLKGNIWRYYYGRRINVLGGAQNIHDKIFGNTRSISKYGTNEAQILTEFFREYKKISQQNKKNLTFGDRFFLEIFGSQISLPLLDFSLGGNASDKETSGGGFQFEAEIQSLLDKNFNKIENSATTGSAMATSTLFLGTAPQDKDLDEFFKEIVGEKAKEIKENAGAILIEEINKEEAGTKNIYLTAASARFGKIDIMGSGDENLVNIEIVSQPKDATKLSLLFNLLANATFSVKSYTSKTTVHLGDTKGLKSIPAVAEWVGTPWARGAALYYLHHQTKGSDPRIKSEQKETERELYQHYTHMKKVYELTGLGLSYEDLGQLNVDFLLVNRARGEEITVYSVRDLIENMKNNKRYSYSLVESLYK